MPSTPTALTVLPLESYPNRYTADLREWESAAFSEAFQVVKMVPNIPVKQQIVSGSVLDRVGRASYGLGQIQELIGTPHSDLGTIYCSDFYTPGLDALAYSGKKFKAFSFCWAQSFDGYDFTAKPELIRWMRPWELMALGGGLYSGVFVANTMLADLIYTALPMLPTPIHVVGLPYNSRAVYAKYIQTPPLKAYDLAFAGRWDHEKQPEMFLDVVEQGQFNAVVCCGLPELRGTSSAAIERAKRMAEAGDLTILTNLPRRDYFNVLAASRCLFNCARQDWVSYTLLDALTVGTVPVYPNFRSFPETFGPFMEYLYPMNDVATAVTRVQSFLTRSPASFNALRSRVLTTHDGTLARIAEIIKKEASRV